MRIDAHQHYWKLERGDYGWLTPDHGVLYRDYMPEDLQLHLATHHIDRTIVVQAAPTIEETEFLLDLCEREKTLAGVVGWLDLEADDFERQYERLRRNRYFIGLRPMLQDLADDAYILRPHVLRSLERLAKDSFPLDLLVRPRHLPHLAKLLKRLPQLHAVVDHLAKPNIATGEWEPWRHDLAQLADYPGIYCKLSGMVTEARHRAWQSADFTPYVRHVLDVFGISRVMFGSDWPVCLLSADYAQTIHVLEAALPSEISASDREALFGGNALKFYHRTDLH